MKLGDLVVHIGAKPNGYRVRLVVAFGEKNHQISSGRVLPRKTVIFVDGRYDWKDMWRVFHGWDGWDENEDWRYRKV